MRGLLFIAAAFGASVGSVEAQNVAPVTQLKENRHEAAQSSGVAIAGVQLLAEVGPVERAADGKLRMALHFPSDWREREVCVATISADGLYDGEATYAHDGGEAGHQETVYETADPGLFAGMGTSELALRILSGPCGRLPFGAGSSPDRPIEATVGYWRTAERLDGAEDMIEILVNPLAAARVTAFVNQGIVPEDRFDCEPAPVTVPTAYALRCALPRHALGASPAMVGLQQLMVGRAGTTTWLKLHFPDS